MESHMTKILRYMSLVVFLVGVACQLTVFAQVSGPTTCQVVESNNGKEISIRGTVVYSPHDFLFAVSGCEDAVVLEFPGPNTTNVATTGLRHRKKLLIFEHYSRAQEKCGRGCMEEPSYKVDAILIGRLDMGTVPDGYWKDGLGYLHDPSGKITGKFGFGHPPVYKYRFVISAVSKTVARRRYWRKSTRPRR